jgi:hypothetical protein
LYFGIAFRFGKNPFDAAAGQSGGDESSDTDQDTSAAIDDAEVVRGLQDVAKAPETFDVPDMKKFFTDETVALCTSDRTDWVTLKDGEAMVALGIKGGALANPNSKPEVASKAGDLILREIQRNFPGKVSKVTVTLDAACPD